MPKPKRIKNLLKQVGEGSEATDPVHNPQQLPQGCTSAPFAPTTLQPLIDTPLQSPQACTSAPFASTTLQPLNDTPLQLPLGCTLTPFAPAASQSYNQAPSQSTQSDAPSLSRKRKFGRESSHYWFVDAIDEEQEVTKKMRLKVRDVHNLPDGVRIVVDFDEFFCPIGEAAGLLAGVCGQLATDSLLFPINIEKWSNMPDTFRDRQWDHFFMRRFDFKVNDKNTARRYIEQSIGKKWRENRQKLWNEFYDSTMSRNAIVNNVPEGINIEQWASYVDYRLRPETMALCKRNQENRKKQTIPHTCGAKTLARRRDDLRKETGKTIGRGPMWNITHKKKDGSFVNDEAEKIGKEIEEHLSQREDNYSEISPNDAVGVVFGKEHSGSVRGLGMGVVPTVAFKHTTTRLGVMNSGSSSANTSSPDLRQKVVTMESQLQALCAYIAMKEGGRLPEELVGLFQNPTPHVPDEGSGALSPNDLRRSCNGSNTHQSVDISSPH